MSVIRINTLTVPGILTLNGSTIDEEINGNTVTSDLINVTGNVTPASVAGTNTINIASATPATLSGIQGALTIQGTGKVTLLPSGSGTTEPAWTRATSAKPPSKLSLSPQPVTITF